MQDRYWTIVFPGEHGQHVQETWSEEQIIKSYYSYWSSKMILNNPSDDISRERCIEDWTIVHWACQTDQWGNNMGWASGSALLGDIILSTQKAIPKKHRKELYKLFIEHFEEFDCDTICECEDLDPEFDAALKELYPEWYEEEDNG